MSRFLMRIAYDGGAYSGWQRQPNALSVQQLLEEALAVVLRKETRITGAGRTDAGVHARGQVAHFDIEADCPDLERLLLSLNGLLPRDIRVLTIDSAAADFHAQRSAKRKEYHYHLSLGPVQLPFEREYAWHVRRPVDLQRLRAAAHCFVGVHDFTTFANVGGSAKTAVREIFRLDVKETATGVRLEFEGSGFLYKMVRNITGMLVAVATGKRSIEEISTLLAAKDRRLAPLGAPAHGLSMLRVSYDSSEVESKARS